jgi:RNA polymerase sigma factor (TIGR02999 family)
MVTESLPQITEWLLAWGEGDRTALDKLVPIVHAELHRMARHYMRHEAHGHLLQTTALVNEAFLRLVDQHRVKWRDRAHFYGISAHLMRQILVDMARARGSWKRGGGARHVPLDEALMVSRERDLDLVALDDALTSLAAFDPRKAQVVELRFFGGMSVEETAESLKISADTVTRDWIAAKAWLYRELGGRL